MESQKKALRTFTEEEHSIKSPMICVSLPIPTYNRNTCTRRWQKHEAMPDVITPLLPAGYGANNTLRGVSIALEN